MTKKHYIQIAVMSLIILIGSVLFAYYYNAYVAPESFVVGSAEVDDYKSLTIKDYLSEGDVIFSQNINDVSFTSRDGTASYNFNFEPKEFNGLEHNYIIYVNDYIVNNITQNAGTISGTHTMNFLDVDSDILCSSDISITFALRSLSSSLNVSLPAEDLGYLMNYFKSDNFIITLALSPFEFGNKDGEVDEKVNQIIELTNQVNSLSGQINTLNGQITDYVQQIADLTNAGADKDEQIAELQSNISTLQSQITSLNSQLSEKSEQLTTIQTENAELLEENTSLNALVTSQQETIASLNQAISQLQYQVSYYEELLEAYQNADKLAVTFKVDNEAYLVQLVDLLGYPTEPTEPTKENHDFLGWSLNGTDVVDVTTIQISNNTTFIAIFEEKPKYTINFYKNEEKTELLTSFELYRDTILETVPEIECPVGYEFLGWYNSETDTILPSEYVIQHSANFIPKFEYVGSWHSVFISSGQVMLSCNGNQNVGPSNGTLPLDFSSTEQMTNYSIENIRITVTITHENSPRDIIINGSNYLDNVTGTNFTYSVNNDNEVLFNTNRVLNLPDGYTQFKITNVEVFY